MGSKSRLKGASFEREIVNTLKASGINAERRAPLQSSRLIDDQGDVYAEGIGRIECKRRARGFKLIYDSLEKADCVVIRDDRKPALIVFKLNDWLARGLNERSCH